MIERNGFTILCMEKKQLTKQEAEAFYAAHSARHFFGELVSFMTSGPSIIMILEREDSVMAWRDLMGSTNPREARLGTIRAMFGKDIGMNATHGSDSLESAAQEIACLFSHGCNRK
jgi:nucleoside-diphosphate kinase